MEARLRLQALDGTKTSCLTIEFSHAGAAITGGMLAGGAEIAEARCAYVRVLEIQLPLAAIDIAAGAGLKMQLSLWQGGLPVDAVPQQGWLDMATTDPAEMAG
jgi:hypothetical protein